MILNVYRRQIKSIAVTLKQLQEGLKTAERAYDCRRYESRLFVSDLQIVVFVFVKRRNDLASPFALHHHRGGRFVRCQVSLYGQNSSAREAPEHASDTGAQTIISVVLNCDTETGRNW